MTEDGVREMRRIYDAGLATFAEIARWYGLSDGGAEKIVKRWRWKHI
jgi:hypothetical protein